MASTSAPTRPLILASGGPAADAGRADAAQADAAQADAVQAAATFGLLADPLRWQIIRALAREQLCTCHLIDITGAKQTTVSHHLRLLREAGLVVGEPEGRFTWYRLTPALLERAAGQLSGLAAGAAGVQRLRRPCES